MTEFVDTDERQDVLSSLDNCVLSLTRSRDFGGAWKWVVLSMHSALQGAMVCHLSGTAQLGALTETSAARWRRWYERSGRAGKSNLPPVERVAAASELFRRLSTSEGRLEQQCGAVIEITDRQRESFRQINLLRNELVHFGPKGWSIDIDVIREAVLDALDVLTLIAQDPWPFRHMSPSERGQLDVSVRKIRSLLSIG